MILPRVNQENIRASVKGCSARKLGSVQEKAQIASFPKRRQLAEQIQESLGDIDD